MAFGLGTLIFHFFVVQNLIIFSMPRNSVLLEHRVGGVLMF